MNHELNRVGPGETPKSKVVCPPASASSAKYIIAFLVVAGLVVALLLATPWVVDHFADRNSNGIIDRSAFGEQFGVTNALFSGLAFTGVIIALWMQRAELQLQRHEIDESQRIMSQQHEEIARQASEATRQNFDNTFFRLLDLQENIRRSIRYTRGARPEEGRAAFTAAANQLVAQIKSANPYNQDRLVQLRIVYRKFYDGQVADYFGQYFRNLYVILKFLDDAVGIDKSSYARMVRAQLSTSELSFLFYNAVAYPRMLALCDRYHMFDNLSPTELAEPSDRTLSQSRFGDLPSVGDPRI